MDIVDNIKTDCRELSCESVLIIQ